MKIDHCLQEDLYAKLRQVVGMAIGPSTSIQVKAQQHMLWYATQAPKGQGLPPQHRCSLKASLSSCLTEVSQLRQWPS